MSHFVECGTTFRDPEALVAALVKCGFAEAQIEVHDEAVPLFGYLGDERPQKAHIVIRKQHIGNGANDVGWEKLPDGSYKSWISEFDSGVGEYRSRKETRNLIAKEKEVLLMARGKHVKLLIHTDGSCSVDAVDFIDASCLSVTNEITSALAGRVLNEQHKPEARIRQQRGQTERSPLRDQV